MKNRKRIIVAFMLVAVMLLGIGYAALTDNLTLTGEATVNADAAQNQWEQDIYFKAARVTNATHDDITGTTSDTATIGVSNTDSANFEVKSLAVKGDKAYFEFDIINEGTTEYDAVLSVDTSYPTNSNDEFFKVTYTCNGVDFGTGGANTTIAAGGTVTIHVTVELLEYPREATTGAFTLNMTATAQE